MNNHIITVGLLTALAVSCSIHEMDQRDSFPSSDKVFYAQMETPVGDGQTKVYVDNDLMVLWHADDRVSIFNKYTYNQEYRFTGKTGANSGSFKKVPNDDFITGNALDLVYAVYPYQESTEISNQGVLSIDLPATQTYSENSFGIGANTMVSCSEGNELMFKNLCGYLMLKLYGDDVTVTSISLKGNNGEPLAGTATVNASVDSTPTLTFGSDASKEISLTFDTPVKLGTTAKNATTFWIVVPPTVFSKGFTLTVKDNKNGFFEKATTKSFEIGRNKLARMSALYVEFITTSHNNEILYTSYDGSVIVPNKTDVFGANIISNSYSNGQGVIKFDGDVISVGNSAFETCANLTSIQIPSSVSSIGHRAFYGCTRLTTLKIPDGVTSISVSLLRGCEQLQSIEIPSSVETIMAFAFAECYSLKGIDLPISLKTIGESAFSSCESIETLNLPQTVQDIGASAFYHCTSLLSVDIPLGVSKIGKSTFSGCAKMVSATLPESVSIIDQFAFSGCTSLSSITIPPLVTRINQFTFNECRSLSSIVIPNEVTRIDECSFKGCSKLTTISIPSSVSIIEEQAFYNCSSLDNITSLNAIPPSGGSLMFAYTNNCPIYVPASSVEVYKAAQYWSDYADRIQAMAPLPEAIDLGLSVRWASFNLGASKPEGYGDYYAWGETEPYYSSQDPLTWSEGKTGYSWGSYKWCMGSGDTMTKYCSNSEYGYNSFTDNKIVLDPEDDVAHVNLGGNWRMPTDSEWTELRKNCTRTFTTQNGVYGRLFTASNGNSIFLPVAGFRDGSFLANVGSSGYYWSSSLYTGIPYNAWYVNFDSSNVYRSNHYRHLGFSVRSVYAE